MKKTLRIVLLMFALALSLGTAQVRAAPNLFIGLQEASVSGGALTDVASGVGIAGYGGSYGSFSFNSLSAMGYPYTQAPLALGSTALDASFSGGTNILTVWISQIGLTSPLGSSAWTSGFTQNLLTAGWTVEETTYLDAGNVKYGTGTFLGTNTFSAIGSDSDIMVADAGSGPFSLTHRYVITAVGAGFANSTINTLVSAVPEPETYALLLAGLGLMGFVARRRRASRGVVSSGN